MKSFLIALLCFVSLTAAGLLDGRNLVGNSQERRGTITNRIQQMTQQDLQRQKFILDVLERIQEQTTNEQIIRLGQNLVVDEQRYVGGIDEVMQRIIDLARQQRLLSRQQISVIDNVDHVEQLQGIHRLLVRSSDWETLQQNIAHLRLNVNGALLANALVMALREREDTQMLIVPAIQEILPEVYFDENVLSRARNIDINTLVQNDVETLRPSLLDVIGLRRHIKNMEVGNQRGAGMLNRLQHWMPWRELHMEMAMRRMNDNREQVTVRGENKLVIPVQQQQQQQQQQTSTENNEQISLLTDDVGLQVLVQDMINQFVLLETQQNDEDVQLQQRNGINRLTMQGDIERNQLNSGVQRRRQQIIDIGVNRRNLNLDDSEQEDRLGNIGIRRNLDSNDLPTSDISSGRLLHVNRRRLEQHQQQQQQQQQSRIVDNQRNRFMDVIQNNRIGGIHRNLNDLDDSRIDSDRLLRTNRRRIDDDIDEDSQTVLRRLTPIGNGRRVVNSRRNNNRDDIEDVRDDEELNINERIRQEELRQHMRQGRIDEDEAVLDGRRIVNSRSNNNREDLRDTEGLNILERIRQEELRRGMRQGRIDEDEPVHDGRRIVNSRSNNNREDLRDTEGLNILERIRQEELRRGMRQGRIDEDEQQEQQTQQSRIRSNNNRAGVDRQMTNDMIIDMLRQKSVQLTDDDIIELVQQLQRQRNTNEREAGIQRTDVNNERLLHVNRRRLNELNNQQQQQQQQRQRGIVDDDDEDISQRRNILGRRVPRSLRSSSLINDDIRSNEEKRQLIVDVLLHNLQQLVARINLERIAVGQEQNVNEIISQRINNPRLLSAMDQSYALRLNEMRLDTRNSRISLEQVSRMERRLQLTIRDQVNQILERSSSSSRSLDVEQLLNHVIGNVLTGRVGNIGVLDMMRELKQVGVGQNQIQLSNPAVQHCLNRMVRVIDQVRQQVLNSYERRELQLDGVTINDVRVDSLRTFTDETDSDLINVLNSNLDLNNDEERIQRLVVARQQRLNHKNFNIDLDVTSDRNQRVVVRMLLGPKTDVTGRVLSLDERRQNFIVLNTLVTDLQTGRNRIVQNSRDITWTARDTTPYTEIYQRVMNAMRGDQTNVILGRRAEVVGQTTSLPHRLLLPRGRVDGLPMQLLVIITPAQIENRIQQGQRQLENQLLSIGMNALNVDRLPLGFPLDRQIQDESGLLELSNVNLSDVLIQHEV